MKLSCYSLITLSLDVRVYLLCTQCTDDAPRDLFQDEIYTRIYWRNSVVSRIGHIFLVLFVWRDVQLALYDDPQLYENPVFVLRMKNIFCTCDVASTSFPHHADRDALLPCLFAHVFCAARIR